MTPLVSPAAAAFHRQIALSAQSPSDAVACGASATFMRAVAAGRDKIKPAPARNLPLM